MLGLLNRIFGSKKAIDTIGNSIDKVFFTNQEKAENWKSILKAYEPFKLAQRLIALLVVSVFLGLLIISCGLYIGGIFNPELISISKGVAEMLVDNLGLPFTLITSFYFGGGAIEGIVSKFKKK